MSIIPVILAGGKGSRMKSALPKVLHPVAGKPMIQYLLDEAAKVTDVRPVVVVGHGAQEVEKAVAGRADCSIQKEQLGTANAVQAAEERAAGKADYVMVIYSDMPCLTAATMKRICDAQIANVNGVMSMLTIIQDDSHGFGRVIRNEKGGVSEIIEEAQATPEILKLKECNVGVYCFRSDWLWEALRRVKKSPVKGEYYLTDLVEIAGQDGKHVAPVVLEDEDEALGVNNRVHLSEAEAVIRKRINRHWMMEGVTMVDPTSVYIGHDVVLAEDTYIYPNTVIEGKTSIGSGCVLGPGAYISDSKIGANSFVQQASVKNSSLPNESLVGPFEAIE